MAAQTEWTFAKRVVDYAWRQVLTGVCLLRTGAPEGKDRAATAFWSLYGDAWMRRNKIWEQKGLLEERLVRLTGLVAKKNPESLLEIGCGFGANLESISRRSPNVRLHGVDISAGMVEETRRRVPDAHVEAADFRAYLGGSNETYDIVLTSGVLMYTEPDRLGEDLLLLSTKCCGCVIHCEPTSMSRDFVRDRGFSRLVPHFSHNYPLAWESLGYAVECVDLGVRHQSGEVVITIADMRKPS